MFSGQSVLVVVPARGGSKGIPLKNLVKLAGKSLIQLVGRVVEQLEFVDRAIVSTDHLEIREEALRSGLSAPFLRPENLSGDRVSDWRVLVHALDEIEKIDNQTYDIVLMLQPTAPLREPKDVIATIEKLIDENWDSVWTVSETDSKGHPLKQMVLSEDGCLDYYEAEGAQIIARQQLMPVYHRNGVAYAFTRDCLVNQQSIKGVRNAGLVLSGEQINIDTKWDIRLAEYIIGNRRD